ncbi:MAG: carboxypeptidase-like regulatory domain-containing protein [Spirochaetota bacterium]
MAREGGSPRRRRHCSARRVGATGRPTAIVLVAVMVVLAVSGCASGIAQHGFERADLHGIVFDLSGRPIAGAEVSVDGLARVHTDLTGRFVLPGAPAGPIRLAAHGEGYEARVVELSFVDRRQIAYLRLASARELGALSESKARAGAYGEAADLARRALAADPGSRAVRFLVASLLLLSGASEEAVEVLAGAWPALVEEARTQLEGGTEGETKTSSDEIAHAVLRAIARGE